MEFNSFMKLSNQSVIDTDYLYYHEPHCISMSIKRSSLSKTSHLTVCIYNYLFNHYFIFIFSR